MYSFASNQDLLYSFSNISLSQNIEKADFNSKSPINKAISHLKTSLSSFQYGTYTTNLNNVSSRQTLQHEDQVKDQDNLKLSSYYNGNQTIIHFPFTTYAKQTNDNDTSQQETQESNTRKFYVKHEDLEYEEFYDFNDSSNNYKQIKYPYQQWRRLTQTPEFIKDIIEKQNMSLVELQNTPQQQVQQAHTFLPSNYEIQQRRFAKILNQNPRNSIYFFDNDKRSNADTNFSTTSNISFAANTSNNL